MEKITKTEEEWKSLLSPEAYQICRRKGTEPPFTGKYFDCKQKGTYHCICCDQPLFSADTKFDSGTGWPSFWQPLDKEGVVEKSDRSFFMKRTEVICARCEAHLGHVFDDGPGPTHLRYCINSAALNLKPDNPA